MSQQHLTNRHEVHVSLFQGPTAALRMMMMMMMMMNE